MNPQDYSEWSRAQRDCLERCEKCRTLHAEDDCPVCVSCYREGCSTRKFRRGLCEDHYWKDEEKQALFEQAASEVKERRKK